MFPGVYTIEFSGTIGTLGDTLLSGPEGKEDPLKSLVQAEERRIRKQDKRLAQIVKVFSSPEGKEVLARMREAQARALEAVGRGDYSLLNELRAYLKEGTEPSSWRSVPRASIISGASSITRTTGDRGSCSSVDCDRPLLLRILLRHPRRCLDQR